MNRYTKRVPRVAVATWAMGLAVAWQVHAAPIVDQRQFVEVVNHSSDEAILLIPDGKGRLNEAGRIVGGTFKRILRILRSGTTREALAVEFTRDRSRRCNSFRQDFVKNNSPASMFENRLDARYEQLES